MVFREYLIIFPLTNIILENANCRAQQFVGQSHLFIGAQGPSREGL